MDDKSEECYWSLLLTWLVWAVMLGSCTTCSLVTASSTSPAPPRTWHTHTPVSLWVTAARLRIRASNKGSRRFHRHGEGPDLGLLQINYQTKNEIILK